MWLETFKSFSILFKGLWTCFRQTFCPLGSSVHSHMVKADDLQAGRSVLKRQTESQTQQPYIIRNIDLTPFSLQVNLFFLLNIVRVLITKLKVTHQAESSLYMKAVRATLILVPLLGIEFVLLPYKPEGRVSSEIYDYLMHILMHYQVSSQPSALSYLLKWPQQSSIMCKLCFLKAVL